MMKLVKGGAMTVQQYLDAYLTLLLIGVFLFCIKVVYEIFSGIQHHKTSVVYYKELAHFNDVIKKVDTSNKDAYRIMGYYEKQLKFFNDKLQNIDEVFNMHLDNHSKNYDEVIKILERLQTENKAEEIVSKHLGKTNLEGVSSGGV